MRNEPEDLRQVRAVADAVLYQNYRDSPQCSAIAKNASRRQFGVLRPVSAPARRVGDRSTASTECLLHATWRCTLQARVRFLRLQYRSVQQWVPDTVGPGEFVSVAELTCASGVWSSQDEVAEHEVRCPEWRTTELLREDSVVDLTLQGGERYEPLYDVDGTQIGRVVRTWWPLSAQLRLRAHVLDVRRTPTGTVERADATDSPPKAEQETPDASASVMKLVKLGVRLDNTGSCWDRTDGDERTDTSGFRALRGSLLSAHLVLSVSGGRFVSVVDPPDWAETVARGCVNHGMWPVLVGMGRRGTSVLASPVLLHDWPEPQSSRPEWSFEPHLVEDPPSPKIPVQASFGHAPRMKQRPTVSDARQSFSSDPEQS